ncbi:MAG: murein L,D-transpeptidase, partial [Gammaproteobacteria bacterium]
QPGWDRQKIDETVAAGKTKRVNLDKPMRIIIGYRTALVIDGQIYFRKDIYKRDAKVLKQLDAKFKLRAADA